jgi:RNA 2',3'-cyclic 3'-phosphodiesterase
MSILRAFIAIELDDSVRVGLEQLQRRLRAEPISGFVRWVAPSSMHLTLKFLGDVDSARVPHVMAVVKAACAGVAPFELAVRGAGCFPNYQRPNVVWAGLIGAVQPVTALAQRIESGCAQLGFEPEDRPFSPHLTLGRVGRETGSSERRQIGDLVRRLDIGQLGVVHADVVHLMRSELKPSGALYSSLGSVKLLS